MRYNNYHKHDHRGNPWTMDVAVKEEDYVRRAVELGHTTCFTVNHGMPGSIFHWLDFADNNNLKLIYGMEAYYVKDRFEKDGSNRHMILIAKNNNGFEQLNDIMSESFQTGFYSRPRIDYELLMGLNGSDFIVTTACVAGIWNDTELILTLNNKFRGNFFLELQNHNFDLQKDVNRKMLELHESMGIPIIHGNDSHYIYPEDSKYRDIFLKGKGFAYSHEDEMILDYPDSDKIFERYEKQGVVSYEQVAKALDSTLIFDDCEKITEIDTEIKLPSVSDNPYKELVSICNRNWKEMKKAIPFGQTITNGLGESFSYKTEKEYVDAIQYELNIIRETNMANYFLIDNKVVNIATEKYGGVLTKTGRGSAPSFFVTKLLGLTNIDRISAPITLFPTRFMSKERILGTKSLPD